MRITLPSVKVIDEKSITNAELAYGPTVVAGSILYAVPVLIVVVSSVELIISDSGVTLISTLTGLPLASIISYPST